MSESFRKDGWIYGMMDGWVNACSKYINFLPDFQAPITPPNATCKHSGFWILYKKVNIELYNITQFQQRDRMSQVKKSMILDQMPKMIRDQVF